MRASASRSRFEVALEGVPLVTPPLVAVSLRAAGRRWHLALFPDSAEIHELRRLRAVLPRPRDPLPLAQSSRDARHQLSGMSTVGWHCCPSVNGKSCV